MLIESDWIASWWIDDKKVTLEIRILQMDVIANARKFLITIGSIWGKVRGIAPIVKSGKLYLG
jgi:hypothetical protein